MSEITLSVVEAGRCLRDLVARARRDDESILLTENGEPVARVVPVIPNYGFAHELADWFRARPRLGTDEAALLEAEWLESRKNLAMPPDPWG
jgi:prevent-host-death family protein